MTASREPMLSTVDLADELQVPVKTVQRWREHGTGPIGHKVGGHVRYSRADVDAWLEQHRGHLKAAS